MNRIRSIISDTDIRTKLLRLIPRDERSAKNEIKDIKSTYPSTMIKLFPNTHSDFGIITEYLLQYPENTIDNNLLCLITEQVTGVVITEKTLNLMSTQRYIRNVKTTRTILDDLAGDEELFYDRELNYENIQGHPDIISSNRIFEVKTSGKAFTDWNDFLLQIFAYGALSLANGGSQNKLHLVLPLQECVWNFNLSEWKTSKEFMEVLMSYSPPNPDDIMFGKQLCCDNNVGFTISKNGSIVNTLRSLSGSRQPFQFFLNGNLATTITMSENDMDEAYAFLLSEPQLRVFVHLPYTITLGNTLDEEDGFTQRSLSQYLTCTSRMGIRGAVVHVANSNKYSIKETVENMRQNILHALEYATKESPLLLETPAGQKNETLTTFDEFMEFVDSIPDERFGICVDTCHVFAAGENLSEYFAKLMSEERWISRLKLIHFNDSKGAFGSCVDRHQRIGLGCIPKDDFLQVVSIASIYQIPMVLE